MKIGIACDHAGYVKKEKLINWIAEWVEKYGGV